MFFKGTVSGYCWLKDFFTDRFFLCPFFVPFRNCINFLKTHWDIQVFWYVRCRWHQLASAVPFILVRLPHRCHWRHWVTLTKLENASQLSMILLKILSMPYQSTTTIKNVYWYPYWYCWCPSPVITQKWPQTLSVSLSAVRHTSLVSLLVKYTLPVMLQHWKHCRLA